MNPFGACHRTLSHPSVGLFLAGCVKLIAALLGTGAWAEPGQLDASFPAGSGPNGRVKAIVESRNGSILVGGSFTEFNGTPVPGLVRLDADGEFDLLFNAEVPGGLPAQPIVALAEGTDGTIYVMTESIFRSVYRLLPDGALDPKYPGVGGLSALNLFPDGSVAGTSYGAFTGDLQFRDPSGQLKSGYPKGLVYIYIGRSSPGSLVDAKLDSKGRLLITGTFSKVGEASAPGVARFNAQGRIEEGFYLQSNGTSRQYFWTLPDAGIVVSSYVNYPKAATRLSLLQEDGNFRLDAKTSPVFDAANAPDMASTVNTVIAERDGKLLVGGSFALAEGKPRRGLARLMPDGSVDLGFEVGDGFALGTLAAYTNELVAAVALQSTGDILVGGAFLNVRGTARPYLARVKGGLPVGAPVIQVPPASVTNHESLTASFSVVAESAAVLTYQWLFKGQPIFGATNSSLTLRDLRPADAGEYRVMVSNSKGSTDSTSARLVVIPAAIPTVSVAVAELRVAPGTSPALVATVSGSPPPEVRWTRNGVAWPGGVVGALTLTNIRSADAGAFRAEASNFMGSARSEEVRVEVTPEGQFPGLVDVGFAADAIDVQALAVDAENRILIGGGFTEIHGQRRSGIARLLADGALDPTFDPGKGFEGGKYQCCLRVGYSITAVKAIAVQSDGHLLVAGNFSSYDGQPVGKLVRLDSSGHLDTEFSTFTVVTGGDVAFLTTLVQQTDGRIVGAGKFKVPSAGMARWLPDGHLDREFKVGTGFEGGALYVASGGFPPIPTLDGTIVYALQVQPDDRVIVGGDFSKYNGQARRALARLMKDGTLDSTFVSDIAGVVQSVALEGDGGLWVASSMFDEDTRIRRLRADGSVDSTVPSVAVRGWVYAMARQADGSVLLGGSFSEVGGVPRRGIARLRSSGELDAGFALPIEGDASWVMALLPTGNDGVMVGGYFASIHGVPRSSLARLQGGPVPLVLPTIFMEPTNQVVQAGHNAVFEVAAVSGEAPRYGWLLNGQPLNGATHSVLQLRNVVETSAGAYQAVVSNAYGARTSLVARLVVRTETPKPGGVDLIYHPERFAPQPLAWLGAMAIDAQDRLAVIGTFTDSTNFQHGIERWLPEGTVDPAFRRWTSGFGAPAFALFQPDGRLLMTYAWSAPGIPGFTVARLMASGEYDPTLNVSLVNGIGQANLYAAALDSDGRILVGGDFDEIQGVPQAHVARLSSEGVVDPSFAPRLTLGAAPFERVVQCLEIQKDGRILVAGNFGSVNGNPVRRLVRLMVDGQWDESFRAPADFDAAILSLQVQEDGRILLGCFGRSTILGVDRGPLLRLNPDGTIDETFHPAELRDPPGPTVAVRAIAEDGAGGLLVGGDFVAGTTERPFRNLARLRGDGSLDASWNASPGTDSSVTTLLIGHTGEVYVGGSFTEVQGIPKPGVARLLPVPRLLRLSITTATAGRVKSS